jgi:prepilin-type N-terminal cleavage/methylation domain-containing protein
MSHTFTKKGLRGFTLIELLVVIAIIGLLSTVIAAPITQARKKGRDGKKVADLHQLVGALQQYSDDHLANFPKSIDGMIPLYLADLPPYAATSTSAKDKYMYSVYETGTAGDIRQAGFHLGTKLEAPSLALGDDRDCTGAGIVTLTASYCVDTNIDSGAVVNKLPSNFVAAVVTDPSFANDTNVLGATFQAGDFMGGSDTASSSCTGLFKAAAAGQVACIYDISN